jgi:iron-sulfur cluster assembly protein
MITISDKAAEAALQAMKDEGKDPSTAVLRVGVQGGGCSGLNYKLQFDPQPRDGDEIFTHGPLRVAIDPKSMVFIYGMTLEFSGGLNGKGFVFNNPNATGTCGCGQSFKV